MHLGWESNCSYCSQCKTDTVMLCFGERFYCHHCWLEFIPNPTSWMTHGSQMVHSPTIILPWRRSDVGPPASRYDQELSHFGPSLPISELAPFQISNGQASWGRSTSFLNEHQNIPSYSPSRVYAPETLVYLSPSGFVDQPKLPSKSATVDRLRPKTVYQLNKLNGEEVVTSASASPALCLADNADEMARNGATKVVPSVGSPHVVAANQQRRRNPKGGIYKCKVQGCRGTFTAKHNLDNHTRSHLGEKPHECPKCLKRFTRAHDRNRHSRKHCPANAC